MILDTILPFFAQSRRLPSFSTLDDHLPSWLESSTVPNMSGVNVQVDTALCYSAVWCALTILSEGLASLPIITYRKDPVKKTRERAEDLELFDVLRTDPNPEMTPFLFIQAFMI